MNLRRLLYRKNWRNFLDEEIREYVERETDGNTGCGINPAEARDAAWRKFGNATCVREDTRAAWAVVWLERWLQDGRYGLRMLWRSPAFSVAVILTLALGIGANAAMFSAMNAVLFRHISYPDAERLTWVSTYDTGWQSDVDTRLLPSDFAAFRDKTKSFENMAAYSNDDLSLSYRSASATERIAWVSEGFWAMSGARPALGRFVGRGEERGAVLTWELYQRRFDSNPSVIGKTVSINRRAFTIVGVLPEGFRFQLPEFLYPDDEQKEVAVFLPIPDAGWRLPLTMYRAGNWEKAQEAFGPFPGFVWMVGKLSPKTSIDRARTELETVYERLIQEEPGIYHTHSALRLQPLQIKLTGNLRPAFLVLGGAVGFVLLIACANIANLLLARATARRQEVAIRRALGAGEARLTRQFLTESALFAWAGTAVGLILAKGSLVVIMRWGSGVVPRLADATIDWRVMAFTAVVSLFAAALFGLGPAVSLLRRDMQGSLTGHGAADPAHDRGSMRVRAAFAALEVGLSVVLLTGAGLMFKSFWRMNSFPPGYSPDRIVTMKISLAGARYSGWPQQQAFLEDLLQRIAAVPGAKGAGVHCGNIHTGVQLEGISRDQSVSAVIEYVSSGYLRTIGVSVLAGQWPDGKDLNAVMINESLARRLNAGRDLIGGRIRTAMLSGRIMGIVPDFKTSQLDAEPLPAIYAPYERSPHISFVRGMVRANTSGATIAAAVQKTASGIDSDVPVYQVETLETGLAESIAPRRFNLYLLAAFAAAAALLAFVGIYGVIAYLVAQRTREIGIRVALGAGRAVVAGMVIRQGLAIAGAGIGAGIPAALGLGHVMTSLLYGVYPGDPWTLLAVASSLTLVAVLACLGPAWHAVRVDPIVAMRSE
jgi:putative ABC transport system permease protein